MRVPARCAQLGAVLLVAGGAAACMPAPGAMLGADASPEGQVAYACALTEHIAGEHGEATEWASLAGEDGDRALEEATAVASLVGSTAAYELPDHPELSAAGHDVLAGFSRADPALMAEGLEAMGAACEAMGGATADVSDAGKVAYACALAAAVIDEHGDAATWDGLGDEPAWHEAASAGALLGGLTGTVPPGAEAMAEGAGDILSGLSSITIDRVQSGLEAVVAGCDA